MKRVLLAIAASILCVTLVLAQGEIVHISPVPAIGTDIAEIARMSEQMAEGTLTGGGRWLRMTYQSASPFIGLVAPLHNSEYNPVDMVRFDLPAGAVTADVDLSVSPSWNALSKTYMVAFSASKGDAPQVTGIEFIPATFPDTVRAFFVHAFAPESFVISTYHRLRGHRVLGIETTFLWAVLLVVAIVLLVLWKRKAALFPLLGIAFGAQMLYGARSDFDLTRLSLAHASEWFGSGTYAEAGSTYALADAVRELESDVQLAICFDSTDYFAKLLRYDLLPMPVQIGTEGLLQPTHIAVVRKIDWSFEDGHLKCGSIDAPATLLQEFPDGSRLFQL